MLCCLVSSSPTFVEAATAVATFALCFDPRLSFASIERRWIVFFVDPFFVLWIALVHLFDPSIF